MIIFIVYCYQIIALFDFLKSFKIKKNDFLFDLISQLSINLIIKKNHSTLIASFFIKNYLFISEINVDKFI